MEDHEFKKLIQEVMRESIIPLEKQITINTMHLDNINVKLHNHLEHNAFQMSGLAKDIEWMKSIMTQPNDKESKEEIKDGIKTQSDVEWLKKFFWVIATASVGGLIAGIMNLLLK